MVEKLPGLKVNITTIYFQNYKYISLGNTEKGMYFKVFREEEVYSLFVNRYKRKSKIFTEIVKENEKWESR